MYTKLVLLTTLVLIVTGAGIFLLLEWDNPETIGAMPVGQKILNGFFQSVTLRTAGFASIDQGAMTDATKAFSVIWMLIGGSSGSTAGGMKTVTVVTIILFMWSSARGRESVNVFKRSIPREKVMDAMTITSIMVVFTFISALVISATSPVSLSDSLYEAASAMATVGLTTGVTTLLSIPAQFLIIILMYFGRVGVLTISLGFMMSDKTQERYRYAHTNLLIG